MRRTSLTRSSRRRSASARRGLASLDYILLLCVIFPLATFVFWAAPRIMNLVYEMLCVLPGVKFGA